MIKYSLFSIFNTNVHIKNLDLDLAEVKQALITLPKYLYSNTKTIYVHDAESLQSKQLDSLHNNNGTIEINANSCKSIKNLLKLLIHELYHSLELDISRQFTEQYSNTVNEYRANKTKVLGKIKSDPRLEKPSRYYYSLIHYDSGFDDYLVNRITYPVLFNRITDLFCTPYALTSISEYIAIGFEVFLFENKEWVHIYNPMLYKLIDAILKTI